MNTIKTLAIIVWVCSSSAFAQIELSYTIRKSYVGATDVEVLEDGRILAGEDSKLLSTSVAVIHAVADKAYKFSAWRTLDEEIKLVPLSDRTDPATKRITKRFLLSAQGIVKFNAVSRSDDLDRSLQIVIGAQPEPDDPKPIDPPKPDPKPVIDVTNDYNVGKIAYQTAPRDPEIASQIAGWYRIGSTYLYGQEALKDIKAIRAEIDAKFSAKQCKDQATCEQWEKWRVAVSNAMVAEQTKRKTFTRQDWFSALVEVANALDKVR